MRLCHVLICGIGWWLSIGILWSAQVYALSLPLTVSISLLPWGLVVIALSISNRPRPPLQLDLSHLALQGGLQMRQFSAGECVIRQGSEAEHFYVITSGRARVLIDDDYGAQTEVAELVAGHFFGEVGLLDNGPRTATVEAVDDLEVLVMNKDSFLHLVEYANVSSDYIRSARDKYRFSTPS